MTTEKIHAITMPKWGLAMTEGLVAAWHVNEGDEIRAGDAALDIETEKITNAFESPVTGLLRRHVASAGEMIPVGGLLGVVADVSVPDADVDAFIERFQSSFVARVPEAETAIVEPQILRVDNRQLRFLKLGEGEAPPLVFIHGFGADLNNWLFNQPALAEAHVAYALDLPGHGASTKRLEMGDIAYLSATVCAFLEALSIDRAHLVGHSLGGAVAADLAMGSPTRVASLTLIATVGLGPEINMDYINGFIKAGRRKELKPVVELLFADPQLIRRELIEDLLKFKRLDGVEEALTTIARSVFGAGQQTFDIRKGIVELDVPVLAIWGSDDRIIPTSHLRALPDRVARHVLDGAGHMVHMEKASEVNKLIGEFVDAASQER